eukprot:1878435-Rhodomonas_salina.1
MAVRMRAQAPCQHETRGQRHARNDYVKACSRRKPQSAVGPAAFFNAGDAASAAFLDTVGEEHS